MLKPWSDSCTCMSHSHTHYSNTPTHTSIYTYIHIGEGAYQRESSPVVHTHLLVSLCKYLGASPADTREVLGSGAGAALNCYYSDAYQRSSGARTAGKRVMCGCVWIYIYVCVCLGSVPIFLQVREYMVGDMLILKMLKDV